MSTTQDFHVALKYSMGASSRLFFKLVTQSFMDRGADLSYLSAFPGESEFLYPPLTFLTPTGQREEVSVDGVTFTVVEVSPRFAS